jgi:hypothetical protein
MIKLKSLQGQLENLEIILEEMIRTGKSDQEIKKIKNQIIEVQRLIAERIIFLQEHPN